MKILILPALLLAFTFGTCAEDCLTPLIAQQAVPDQMLPLPTTPPVAGISVFRRSLPSDVGTAEAWLVQTPNSAAVIVSSLAGITVYRCYEVQRSEYVISKACPPVRVTHTIGVDTVIPLRVDLEPVDPPPSESWISGQQVEIGKQVCSESGCTQWRASWPNPSHSRQGIQIPIASS